METTSHPPYGAEGGLRTRQRSPETALQGQVPRQCAQRLQGVNCNLELSTKPGGNGANWQTTQFIQRSHDAVTTMTTIAAMKMVVKRHAFAAPRHRVGRP